MIFISYNEVDITTADFLNQMLKNQNFSTWINYEYLVAGYSIKIETEKKITDCNCFIFCIGKQGISPMQEIELSIALKHAKRILPILLPNNETSVRHSVLDNYLFVDFRRV